MKRDIGTILVGLLFLAAGIAVGGSMLGFFDFTFSFRGWWTLFLIIPALLAISQGGINAGNLILLSVGIILLLDAQNILPSGFSWRLILPVVLLGVGFNLLFGNRGSTWFGRKVEGEPDLGGGRDPGDEAGPEGERNASDGDTCAKKGGFTDRSTSGNGYKTASALFGGQDLFYGHEEFTGASYTAIFGGLTINLRNVKLAGDVIVNVTAIFGGIDLILPENVQVVSNVIPVLGGADCKYPSSRDSSAPRIIVNGSVAFGGVTIK